jgi:hypothetical protein
MGKAGRKPYNYYIRQEIYVLVDEVKRQQKLKSTRDAIYKFFETDKFKDLAAGKPYQIFIDSLLRNTKDRLEDYQTIMHDPGEMKIEMEEYNYYCVDPETGEFLSKEEFEQLEKDKQECITQLSRMPSPGDISETSETGLSDKAYKFIWRIIEAHQQYLDNLKNG